MPSPTARVCPSCGLGLLLETRSDVAPTPRDPFLVVDSALLVQAVSRRAQKLLAIGEELAINRPVASLLVPAEARVDWHANLASAVVDAIAGEDRPTYSIIRPWNTYGVRRRVRIAPCGPPRAALIVIDQERFPTLRPSQDEPA